MNAIIETETQGVKKAGQSGELVSYTQLMPDTWKDFATTELGYVPELTDTNEKYVVAKTLQRWIAKGMSDKDIMLRWNAGNATKCSKGINSKGVPYDSCMYVIKAINNLKQQS